MKKYFKIVSSVVVAIATIGFAWVTDYDSNIKAAEKACKICKLLPTISIEKV